MTSYGQTRTPLSDWVVTIFKSGTAQDGLFQPLCFFLKECVSAIKFYSTGLEGIGWTKELFHRSLCNWTDVCGQTWPPYLFSLPYLKHKKRCLNLCVPKSAISRRARFVCQISSMTWHKLFNWQTGAGSSTGDIDVMKYAARADPVQQTQFWSSPPPLYFKFGPSRIDLDPPLVSFRGAV